MKNKANKTSSGCRPVLVKEINCCLLFLRSRASVKKTLALTKIGLARKRKEIQFTKEEQ